MVFSHNWQWSSGRTPSTVLYLCHTAQPEDEDAAALVRLLRELDPHTVRPLVLFASSGPLVGMLSDTGIDARVLPLPSAVRDIHRNDLTVGGMLRRARHALRILGHASDIARLAQRNKAALIHTVSLRSAVYGGLAGRMSHLPVVWQVRERVSSDRLPSAAVRLMRSLAQRLPACILGDSQETLDALVPAATAAKGPTVRVVPDGLTADELTAGNCAATVRLGRSTATATAAAFATAAAAGDGIAPTQPMTIGVVGPIERERNLHVFLEAAAQLLERRNIEATTAVGPAAMMAARPVRFVIAGAARFGGAQYAEGLREQAAQLGIAAQVEFVGPPEDQWSLLRRLDILVAPGAPSRPVSHATLAGMAVGLPVVACDSPAVREVIADSETGLLVPDGDAREMAFALGRLLDNVDLQKRIGRAASTHAANQFRASKAARTVEDAYKSLLPRPAAAAASATS